MEILEVCFVYNVYVQKILSNVIHKTFWEIFFNRSQKFQNCTNIFSFNMVNLKIFNQNNRT